MSLYGRDYDHALDSSELRELKQYQRKFKTIKVLNNRARIIEDDGVPTLLSYRTKVAKVVDGKLVRLWGSWSATTAVHVRAFCDEYSLHFPYKAEWMDMPLGG